MSKTASGRVAESSESKTARALRKAIAKRTVHVEEGQLIRFRSRSRTTGINYWYGAIFVADRWWLTSKADYFGKQAFSTEELLDIIARDSTTDVEIVTEYTPVK